MTSSGLGFAGPLLTENDETFTSPQSSPVAMCEGRRRESVGSLAVIRDQGAKVGIEHCGDLIVEYAGP